MSTRTLSLPRRRWTLPLLGLVLLGGFLSVTSCTASVENRNPLGELFPPTQGTSLEGEPIALPPKEPSILLVGYVQKAQFDADRWLVGLLQVTPPAKILEVPAVAGLFPRLIAGTIDGGMRKGIPQEDWQSVVTCYGAAAADILQLTGNQNPRNIRVLLLDGEGQVRWFHDRGFSASKLLELGEAASLSARANAE